MSPAVPMRDLSQLIDVERLRHIAEYVAFRVIVCLVDIFPFRTSIRLAEALAFIIHRLLPKKLTRYNVARDNIRQAFGNRYTDAQIDDIIRRMWVHLFRVDRRNRASAAEAAALQLCRRRSVQGARRKPFGCFAAGGRSSSSAATSAIGRSPSARSACLDFRWASSPAISTIHTLHRWFVKFRRADGPPADLQKGGGCRHARDARAPRAPGLNGRPGRRLDRPVRRFLRQAGVDLQVDRLVALEYRAYIAVGYAVRLPDDFESTAGSATRSATPTSSTRQFTGPTPSGR